MTFQLQIDKNSASKHWNGFSNGDNRTCILKRLYMLIHGVESDFPPWCNPRPKDLFRDSGVVCCFTRGTASGLRFHLHAGLTGH
jgi:hypothetical protein